MVGWFAEICIAHEGDVAGARAALLARHLRPLPAAAARGLMVHPGQVFDVRLPAEHLLVLSFNNGMCGTVAPAVEPGALLLRLAEAMKQRGVAVDAIGTSRAGSGQAYRLIGPAVRLELMVDIERRPEGTQASMLAAALD